MKHHTIFGMSKVSQLSHTTNFSPKINTAHYAISQKHNEDGDITQTVSPPSSFFESFHLLEIAHRV